MPGVKQRTRALGERESAEREADGGGERGRRGGEQDISLARAAGFDRHLTKPVDPQEVEQIVNEMSEATFKRPGAISTAAPPVSDGRDRGV